MSFWNTFRIGLSALNAQRLRLDVIANNVANADTTRTAAGGPYQRQDVVFMPEGNPNASAFTPAMAAANHGNLAGTSTDFGGVTVPKIITDTSPGTKVYDPTHPDADASGYVTYPNVNLVVEMTNMLSASRSYEANLSMMDTAKKMAQAAINIGR
jgi:flagellar basal-body rod protein FlgC